MYFGVEKGSVFDLSTIIYMVVLPETYMRSKTSFDCFHVRTWFVLSLDLMVCCGLF